MKRTTPETVTVNDTVFFVFPFSAFTAANLSGEVIALIGPVVGSFLPLAGKGTENAQKADPDEQNDPDEQEGGILDREIDMEEAGKAVANAFCGLSGDKVERLLRKLLVDNGNIAYENENGKRERLTPDTVDELFCGNAQGLFVLAFHVIRVNYSGFFGKLPTLFGNRLKSAAEKAGISGSMASLT